MKFVFASFGFIAVWLAFIPVARSQSETEVRVRLKARQDEFVISGTDLQVRGQTENFRSVAYSQTESLRVRRFQKEGRAYWLISRQRPGRSYIVSEKFVLITGQNLRAGSQELPAKILLAPSGPRQMDLIALLPLEEYVTGVVASEMPLTWPLETLKAQAIASRSYALAVMQERQHKVYHLESSVLDQVFRKVFRGNETGIARKAAEAVRETRGVTLWGSNNRVLKAFYHSDCGGHTASARDVWHSGINSGEATDAACPANPKAHWELSLDKEDLYSRLKKYLALGDKPLRILGLQFIPIPGEERIQDVRVAFNDGESRKIDANDFRAMVGFQEMRSTLFQVSESDKVLSFSGRGFGHGVGLCQWGSRYLGLQGKKYPEILKHYYPLARLKIAKESL